MKHKKPNKSIQPKDFDKLQREWYTVLKDTGFTDIEQSDGNLKRWHSHFFSRSANSGKTLEMTLVDISAKVEYYRQASQFLYDHEFESPLHKLIWQYHSEGRPYRKIAEVFKELGINKSAMQIQNIIYKLEAIMFKSVQNDDE